jgi:DNA mismatch repair protein MutS2
VRLDVRLARQAIAFGFASGDARELVDRTIDEAPLAPTAFARSGLAEALFLGEVVDRVFAFRDEEGRAIAPRRARIVRMLARPASDPATTLHRQRVLAELVERPDLEVDLLATHAALVAWTGALAADVGPSVEEQHAHRVEALTALRAAIEGLAARFEGARSGLATLGAFGRAVRASEAFAALGRLLDDEAGLVRLGLDVELGADGRIRALAIAGSERRAFGAIARALLGQRFGVEEIAARLFDAALAPLEDAAAALLQIVGDVELLLGALAFRRRATTAGLAVCLPELVASTERGAELEGLFDPLLLDSSRAPVPWDVSEPHAGAIVVVTGANSGGKTRLLESVALAQLLAQAGLFVPARRAVVPRAEGLFVSFSIEASATHAEGRLGTELARVLHLFDELGPGDLVVVDELCSGTNPSEAEALIDLVLDVLAEAGIRAWVSTHFLDLAARLARETTHPRMVFLRAAVDAEGRPRFAFEPGVATSALAGETAARLGLTREGLRARIGRRRAATGRTRGPSET